PEDVGGPTGYAAYLEALIDPQHEDHADMLEWNGTFNPDAFDIEAINARLRKGFDAWEQQISREMEGILDEDGILGDLDELEDMSSSDAASPTDAREPKYPIGTVACYGPDATTTTRIVAGVIRSPGDEPLLQRWV